jgi:hypothetical protein
LPDADKHLERLFNYTKFPISLSPSAAGALVTRINSAERNAFIQNIIASPRLLAAASVSSGTSRRARSPFAGCALAPGLPSSTASSE